MESMDPAYAFHGFLRRGAVSAIELIENPNDVLTGYLRHLVTVAASPRFALDVKHNHLHFFDGPARLSGDRPGIVNFFRRNRFQIVHLIRQGLVSQYLSIEMARQTNVYHLKGSDPHPKPAPFTVDIPKAKLFVHRAEESLRRMRIWTRGYPRYHEVLYEDLFVGNQVNLAVVASVSKIFGVTLHDLATDYVKFSYDFGRIVSNSDELVSAFAKTPYAKDAVALFSK